MHAHGAQMITLGAAARIGSAVGYLRASGASAQEEREREGKNERNRNTTSLLGRVACAHSCAPIDLLSSSSGPARVAFE